MERENLIACHECDLLLRRPARLKGLVARCSRCGASLIGVRTADVTLDRVCAITVAALITFLIAQCFPVIELESNGMSSRATLFGAVSILWSSHMPIVAAMVFCSTMLFPLVELCAFLYVLIPLRAGHVPPRFNAVLRAVQFLRPWGMIEVFMLGVLVTIVKMVSLARVIPGTALFAFGVLTLMLGAIAAFDPRLVWDVSDEMNLYRRPGFPRPIRRDRHAASAEPGLAEGAYLTAKRAGLVACHTCGLVQARIEHQAEPCCSRCESTLHERRPDSAMRTLALVSAAALLYIPANLLPIMYTTSMGRLHEDTILSGVAYFWTSGDWPLAAIIFMASIMVPTLKLVGLAIQAVAACCRSRWKAHERAKLHRIVERIGRWSMLDIFVITLTVALVHFGSFAVAAAGPGAIAFGAVVILTMLASMQFDPRLIWDDTSCRSEAASRR